MQETTRKAAWPLYLIRLLVTVAVIGGALFYGIETTEVRSVDLQTMRLVTVTSWSWYGIRLRQTVCAGRRPLSDALEEKGLTTGCKGSLRYWRSRQSSQLVPFPRRREIVSHSIPGERVRSVACSFELADLVRKKGARSLPYLRTVIAEASDDIGFPNWSFEKAEETAKKLVREAPE